MIHYITRYVNLILAIDFFSKSILSGENYIKMFRTFYYCMTGLKKEQKKKNPEENDKQMQAKLRIHCSW